MGEPTGTETAARGMAAAGGAGDRRKAAGCWTKTSDRGRAAAGAGCWNNEAAWAGCETSRAR